MNNQYLAHQKVQFKDQTRLKLRMPWDDMESFQPTLITNNDILLMADAGEITNIVKITNILSIVHRYLKPFRTLWFPG